MVGIILVGHGKFATGLKSSIDLIVGEQKNFKTVDFLKTDSVDDLKNNIKNALDSLDTSDGVLFFTDVVGGSPFKTSVLLSNELKNSEVISGTNLPAIVEILFEREIASVKDLKDKAIENGKNGLQFFKPKKKKKVESNNGI
ncbi:MAG: PTS sugar transporter subunit IIA [Firmicutes bacterium]|nr:PTS sugar transporter subunit IIA [Bacillota bacterium]